VSTAEVRVLGFFLEGIGSQQEIVKNKISLPPASSRKTCQIELINKFTSFDHLIF
jgi:hypothetical protein